MIGLGDLEKNFRRKSRFTHLLSKYHAQRVGQDHAEYRKEHGAKGKTGIALRSALCP